MDKRLAASCPRVLAICVVEVLITLGLWRNGERASCIPKLDVVGEDIRRNAVDNILIVKGDIIIVL